MQDLIKLTLLLFTVNLIASCKKDQIKTTPFASITMVNAITGGTTVKLGSNFSNIFNNNYAQLALPAGSNDLYIWPVDDSLHPYYTSQKFSVQDREVYSLFLGGTPEAVNAVLIKEEIPYRTDSTLGIRFINMSPNSSSLSVTLSTSPDVNEVADLAYQSYTEFKSYAGLYNNTYTFQIRDASTPNPVEPLATFTLNPTQLPRFANITLVIRGLVGSDPALGITRVNNDR